MGHLMRDLALAIFVCVMLWMLTDVLLSVRWGFVPVGSR